MHPDPRLIKQLAYQLWEARGCPVGAAEQDWFEAERQLVAQARTPAVPSTSPKGVDNTLKDSFPASDPPASHLPDVPPANADAKWAAAGVQRKTVKRRTNPKPPSSSSPPDR